MPSLTREELHKLVWADPMRTVAQRFDISDVGLKKHCVAAGIPVPERGYWNKLAAGKRVQAQWLPLRDPGASNVVQIGRDAYSWNSDPEKRLAEPVPEAPTFSESLDAVRARTERRLGKIKSVRTLESPHAGLRKLLNKDLARAQKFAEHSWAWDKPIFTGGFERRRLAVLNSLAIGLSKIGAKLEVGGPTGRQISVRIGDTPVELGLDHPTAKPNRHGEWQIREGSADDLKLVIGNADAEAYQPIWLDDETGNLEAKLSEIGLEIIVAGEALYRERRLAGHKWLLEERARLELEVRKRREEAERRDRERRAAEAKARQDQLFGQAEAWRSARDIRGFVAEVLASQVAAAAFSAAERWAAWALHEADLLDPVTNGGFAVPESFSAVSDRPPASCEDD